MGTDLPTVLIPGAYRHGEEGRDEEWAPSGCYNPKGYSGPQAAYRCGDKGQDEEWAPSGCYNPKECGHL